MISAQDYYPFGSLMPGRQYNNLLYRYGFNGQEKTDEISGTATHTTALFWEYDARLGRRWDQDPKPNPAITNYAAFTNNPMWFTDPLGDTVRTNSEGYDNTVMGVNGILDGRANPIGFDQERGILTYNKDIDISGYSDFQKEVLGRYAELIGSKTDVNLQIIDIDEKIDGKSLKERNAVGLTKPWKYQDGSIAKLDVYVARNPMKTDGKTPERKEYAGITNVHEMAGHAYLRLTQPLLKTNDHNKLVEDFHKAIFLNFKINGAIWYKKSTVPLHEREAE